MAGRLEGKVAVLTGGASGIGEGTARRFVDEGARIVIAGADEAVERVEPFLATRQPMRERRPMS